MVVTSLCKEGGKMVGLDNGKYVRYTPEQVEALERLYHECPKPSSIRRQQLIRECPILSNIEPKQIKVWFQNRRCREKQRKESSRLQSVNRKLTAMNKLLMEENDRLQKQVSQLSYENGCFRHQTQSAGIATTDTSGDSVVTTSGQRHRLRQQRPQMETSPAGLLSIAEETLTEFLSKATGTAVEWVQMPGMKPGPDSMGIVAISQGCTGVAARACGLVGLEPAKVAEILKDRPSWLRHCRSVDVVNVLPTGTGGTIESLYMQLYAPTTLAPARDFWLLRYSSGLEDGSIVVCERSLSSISMPAVPPFVRAEILPSGYLIRPCEGGGSIIHIVDHMDLEPWSVPEVIRPLYESSARLAQQTTMAAFKQLRQSASELCQAPPTGWARCPGALRALGLRLSRGFNEALNGFTDDGWSAIGSGGMDDVTVSVNCSNMLSNAVCTVLCAKASMLIHSVQPALLIRFLREHRSEWADGNIDAYLASAVKGSACSLPGVGVGSYQGQIILPLTRTVEDDEFLEILKLEHFSHHQGIMMPRDLLFLQLCSGVEENAVGNCSELIFAPIDASFAEDSPLVPSGFRIIPLELGSAALSPNQTLDLASSLEVGPEGNRFQGDYLSGSAGGLRSVMTIAFQFTCETHFQDSVAAMAKQYVRSIISSIQRVALALSPNMGPQQGLVPSIGNREISTLCCWICRSYRCHFGVELVNSADDTELVKLLWHHSDAILCCSLKAMPIFTFANQAGLDMLETTLVALQDIPLEKIFDDRGKESLRTNFAKTLQQGSASLEAGVCISSMGRLASYDKAAAWKVCSDADNEPCCVCFMFSGWAFL